MYEMEIINKYFPELDQKQLHQFSAMEGLYRERNAKINLISRKDIDHLYQRHILHSLAIAKFVEFEPGTLIMDAGTGGGFPGIPLAIHFPYVRFVLVDSIGKKIRVCNEVVSGLGLTNVETTTERIESVNRSFDFVVSRAVKNLPLFYSWVKNKIKKDSYNNIQNGIIYLKGGNFKDELKEIPMRNKILPLNSFFEEEFFESKKLVYLYK